MNFGSPIATDNIFKFYALYGLTIFVSSVAGHLYLSSLEFAAYTEALRAKATVLVANRMGPPPTAQQVATSLVEESVADLVADFNRLPRLGCWALTALSIFLAVMGFRRWHQEIQPKLDERESLERKHLESQIAKNLAEARKSAA